MAAQGGFGAQDEGKEAVTEKEDEERSKLALKSLVFGIAFGAFMIYVMLNWGKP